MGKIQKGPKNTYRKDLEIIQKGSLPIATPKITAHHSTNNHSTSQHQKPQHITIVACKPYLFRCFLFTHAEVQFYLILGFPRRPAQQTFQWQQVCRNRLCAPFVSKRRRCATHFTQHTSAQRAQRNALFATSSSQQTSNNKLFATLFATNFAQQTVPVPYLWLPSRIYGSPSRIYGSPSHIFGSQCGLCSVCEGSTGRPVCLFAKRKG